jgi:hypothetical protein
VLRATQRLGQALWLNVSMLVVCLVVSWVFTPSMGIVAVGVGWLLGQSLGALWVVASWRRIIQSEPAPRGRHAAPTAGRAGAEPSGVVPAGVPAADSLS